MTVGCENRWVDLDLEVFLTASTHYYLIIYYIVGYKPSFNQEK